MKTTYKIKQLIEALHNELENTYDYDFEYIIEASGFVIAMRRQRIGVVKPQTDEHAPIEFTRINNDINGNPRYVCHFLDLLTEEESNSDMSTSDKYNVALVRSRKLGGKKFHNKKYGGGIVFQTYDTKELERDINKLKGE